MNGSSKPSMMTPALIGGTVAGVLSGLPFLNCLCCLWILGGAMLSVHLLARDSKASITSGDGAILGVLTGIVAAVVDSLLGIPLRAVNLEVARRFLQRLSEFAEDMPSGWESYLGQDSGMTSAPWFLVGLFVTAVIFAILGALGGILGASLFGKKPPAAAAPPAPTPAAPQGSPDAL